MKITRPIKAPPDFLNLSESDAIDILHYSSHNTDLVGCKEQCGTAKIIRWLRAKRWEITDD